MTRAHKISLAGSSDSLAVDWLASPVTNEVPVNPFSTSNEQVDPHIVRTRKELTGFQRQR